MKKYLIYAVASLMASSLFFSCGKQNNDGHNHNHDHEACGAKTEQCCSEGEHKACADGEKKCCSEGEKKECCNDACANALTIVATLDVKPEFLEELLPAFEKVIAATRAEEGNVAYNVFESTDNPNSFTFVEVWKSKEAIDAHNASEHFAEFAKAVEGKADLKVSVLKRKF